MADWSALLIMVGFPTGFAEGSRATLLLAGLYHRLIGVVQAVPKGIFPKKVLHAIMTCKARLAVPVVTGFAWVVVMNLHAPSAHHSAHHGVSAVGSGGFF